MRIISCWVLLFVCLVANAQPKPTTRDYAAHVTIARDKWGVPHIFGEKDADVAYGLAWANSEDDFSTVQETFLAAKNCLGRAKGKKGVELDYLAHFLGGKQVIADKYYKDLSPHFIEYIEAYAAGLNAYARTHPKEVKVKKAFPITGHEVMEGYFLTLGLVSYAHQPVEKILGGGFDSLLVSFGSNGMAYAPSKTTNGNTMLTVNPHVSMQGFLSWYEAHLHSDEGMDILGALFHGSPCVFVGTTPNLGWTHTWNLLDLVDTYKLKMNPHKKLQYEFDGQWKKLEKRPVWLKVKLGGIVIPVKKTTYVSIYGPTLQSKNGQFFSIRYPAHDNIKTIEQWFTMDKAKNFDEFYKALKMEALPRFHIVYADKDGHIFFMDDGMIPIRDTSIGCNWQGVVAGNTSKTLWDKCYPVEYLPQVKDPSCGYVFNMNNTPYDATCDKEDIPFGKYPAMMCYRTGNNNRSERFKQLMNGFDKVSYEDMKRIKFDSQYPDTGVFLSSIQSLYKIDPNKYPNLKESITLMQHWDKKATDTAHGAALLELAIQYIFDKKDYNDQNFLYGVNVDEPLWITAIQYTQDHMLKYFGKVDVLLGDFQRLRRGSIDVPLPGFPDMLAANYSHLAADGRDEVFVGDSYTMLVEYDKNGPTRIETLSPFGASTHAESPHYADQIPLFQKHQSKVMTMNKEEIMKTAERIYHPQ